MSPLVTFAQFGNISLIRFRLGNELNVRSGFRYRMRNKNARIVKPVLLLLSNQSIEIKVGENDVARVAEVLK